MSVYQYPSGIFPIACDHCSHAIRSPEDGMLLWILDPDGCVKQTVIVHNSGNHNGCTLPEGLNVDFLPLWEAIDVGGLLMLCELLKAEPYRAAMLAEVIERLHVPGFDRVRNLRIRFF